MTTLLHKLSLKVSLAGLLALMISVSGHTAQLNLANVPLYLLAKADPNVLINMSVETPMGGAAYNDNVGIPSGCAGRRYDVLGDNNADDIGSCYSSTTRFLGYFDSEKCYTYTSNRFEPAGATGTGYTCTGQWSGNFLNWATMTAIDMFILQMTGGNRVQDTASLTVIRRARKQDNNSWFPRKVLNSTINVAPSTVTPHNVTTLFIHNTAWGVQMDTTFGDATGSSPDYSYNVDVKVCATAADKEANCVAYGTSPVYYKPEGLIQRNATTKRFAVMSYTFDNAAERDGGVLRSNMKYVGPTLPDGSDNTAKEYGTNGLLIDDPNGAAGSLNSGVINYINKFSTPGYKSRDPIGELFYEGVRYFKNLGPTPEYSSSLDAGEDGDFEIVNSWNDPIQYRCQKNFVVAINDANPWLDKKLPGTFFTSSSISGASGTVNLNSGDYGEPSNADPDINVRTLTNSVGSMEGLHTSWPDTGTWTSGSATGTNDSVGGGAGTFDNSCTAKTVAGLGEVMGTCPSPGKQNSYYIAGLAYYANTTDLRPAMANDRGMQNVQSFFIDTQEFNANPLDGPKNMLWLAGKYGGFSDTNSDSNPHFQQGTSGTVAGNAEWDADNNGIPDNYVLATQPQALVAGLTRAFDFIDERTSSASSASVNSGSISSESRLYQARFDSSDWTGELLIYQVNQSNGTLSTTPKAVDIPAHGSRSIFTRGSTGAAMAFNWTSINADTGRKSDLSFTGDNDTDLQNRVNYLRGNQALEQSNGGPFRNRSSRLGDIVSSAPLFVGAPPFRYRDTLESAAYSTFRDDNDEDNERTKVVYVGANDGMLHAFNANAGTDEGKELFAYIPGAVFKNLKQLSQPDYKHGYYVDGSPNMGDVFWSGAWHTVLVGSLNKGGQGIYALDITNPSSFSTSDVLWEFNDVTGTNGDADLGYTFSRPAIVRLNTGVWAAIFGNGYNNTEADGNASTTGYAALYIVNIRTGALIKEIPVPVGSVTTPNGLATPAVVDFDGDADADYVYAGDLRGNLWKFDLTGTNVSSWGIPFSSAGVPQPLYVASDGSNLQPITSRAEIGRGPNGNGMLVLFGTGKFIEDPVDRQITPQRTQTFYGIYDTNTSSANFTGRTDLQAQTITHELNETINGVSYGLRITTDNAPGSRGWYMDLVAPSPTGYQGERVVANPLIRNNRVVFTTLIPDSDPCGFGGSSWLMELDALTGKRLTQSPFDLNRDGQFTSADFATMPDGSRLPASGMRSSVGITPEPGVLTDPSKSIEYKYTPGTSGNIQMIGENPGAGSVGRQSWRQIR